MLHVHYLNRLNNSDHTHTRYDCPLGDMARLIVCRVVMLQDKAAAIGSPSLLAILPRLAPENGNLSTPGWELCDANGWMPPAMGLPIGYPVPARQP
jgi:hypothetical protein